jgi:hypothetical protein
VPGGAARSCSIVPVHAVDAALRIDAEHVKAAPRRSPPGSLICSYYGSPASAGNEATIVYLTADAAQFGRIVAAVAKAHPVRQLSGIGVRADAFSVPPERYIYLLQGSTLAEVFATATLARLEVLARAVAAAVAS